MTPEQATALIQAVAALATAIGGLIVAVGVLYAKLERNQRTMNGHLAALVSANRQAGHAEGVALGQQLAHANDPPATPPLPTG